MSEQRCATCRFWAQPADGGGEALACYPAVKGWGSCARVEMPGHLAYATADDDWGRTLLTSPDFGCVQWETDSGVSVMPVDG